MKLVPIFAALCAAVVKNENLEAPNSLTVEKGERFSEGDIIPTQEQIDGHYIPIDTRKAIKGEQYRWTNGVVPFVIDPRSEPDRKLILSALKHWSDNTCLRFTEVKMDHQQPHVIFMKSFACASDVGMQQDEDEPPGQLIMLAPGCTTLAAIVHEVGHAIGFHHEHNRSDRDQHIKILFENIEDPLIKEQYSIEDTDNLGLPYDFASLMHYGIYAGSTNGKKTIDPFDINQIYKTAQEDGLSFLDIKMSNILYKCDANCTSKPVCQNEGFVDQYCRCHCPSGYEGRLCERYVGVPDTCGGRIEQNTTIRRPNLPRGRKCVWIIKAPYGQHIKFRFQHFDLHERTGRSNACEIDSLTITDGSFSETYCGTELQGRNFSRPSNEIKLEFEPNSEKHSGFIADVGFI